MSFGSFLAFYLADLGWSKQNVGLALTVGGLAGVAAQIPGGALADAVRWKRGLAASGFVLIAASALILALRPGFSLVFVAEILHGMTGGIVGPAIAAISLGLAGRHGMSSRVGRNYRFAGAGNALTATLMGGLGAYLSNSAIFIAAAVLCIPALIALSEIRPNEIDYVRARNATKRDHTLDLQRLVDFTKNWRLVLFAGCLVLFHCSSASLLPLVSENLAHSKVANSPLFMAGLIAVPQVVVAILAPWIGYWSELWGRKPLLLAAFALEAARALLFAWVSDPVFMMVSQLLDGVTGAAVTALFGAGGPRHADGHGRGRQYWLSRIHRSAIRRSRRISVDGCGDYRGRRPALGPPAGKQAREIRRLMRLEVFVDIPLTGDHSRGNRTRQTTFL
jgi:MFS family permease